MHNDAAGGGGGDDGGDDGGGGDGGGGGDDGGGGDGGGGDGDLLGEATNSFHSIKMYGIGCEAGKSPRLWRARHSSPFNFKRKESDI